MFPLWDVAIAPVIHAAQARRIVQIGAWRGETTERMLGDLGPDAELDVIDPEPAFDPAGHEDTPGRYRFIGGGYGPTPGGGSISVNAQLW